MEYNVQNLEYAVSVFYSSEQNEKMQAHQWLTTAQRCPEAWVFVWELLQTHKSTEVQFFAATTLHTKILRCWNEVPPDNYEELKNKLLQSVLMYSKGPKIVLNRLCISLAAYILQQNTSDLVTILSSLSSSEHSTILLEILTVIPEEFNSMTMDSMSRIRNRTMLQQACPAVLDDMLQHLQSVYSKEQPSDETIETWTNVSVCAASWLTQDLSRGQGVCSVPLTNCIPLCHALLQMVHVLYTYHEAVSDSALEACEAALNAVRIAGSASEAFNYPAAGLQLMFTLADLSKPIIERDNVPNSINEELLAAILTCAVALGETHTLVLVQTLEAAPHEGATRFLELLMAGQASPGYYPQQETRSQLVFGFWVTLQDQLQSIYDGAIKISEKWRAIYTRLFNILIEKSEIPPEESLTREDSELIRCYRQDIADTVMYCHGVLGEWCWKLVSQAWTEGHTSARREAALHTLLALGDAAPSRRAPVWLRELLPHAVCAAAAQTSELRLTNTALDCLGAYAGWLGSLQDSDCEQGSLLTQQALQAAGAALQRSPQPAALALKKLCIECSDIAAPLAREITSAAQSVNAGGDAWVRRQLLSAAGAALAACEPATAAPLLQELALALDHEIRDQSASKQARVSSAEQAAALLSALTAGPTLAKQLVRCVLPALTHHALDPELVPSLFQVIRQIVSVLLDDCVPLLQDISQLSLQAINTYPCPDGIDVIRLIVIMFDTSWSGTAALLRGCVAASAAACVTDAAASCDVTQALFIALQAITKKKPHYVDALNDYMPDLVELGCRCVRLWEAGAARAACGWLAALALARPQLLQSRAPALTNDALACIGGGTPRNQVEPLAELLLALNRAQWAEGNLGQWLQTALAQGGFPTAHATDQHKQQFINNVIKERNNKRRLYQCVHEFSLVCRGLIGTEYGRQTLHNRLLVT